MQISPVSSSVYSINKPQKAVKKPSFGSIIPDAKPENVGNYELITMIDSDFHKLRLSSTRIFRELPAQNAIAKLLNPDEKSEIKILGCSDGSEAWAHAIVLKEIMGKKAQQNVKIEGIDKADYLIEIAKTGKIVCSDTEKDKYTINEYNISGLKSPVYGDGWDKYLIKSSRPEDFNQLLKKEPCLKYLEYDPVARINIGNGMNWYEVNKEGLPEVKFTSGDMLNHLESEKDSKTVVYVLANAGAYLIEKDPNKFTQLFIDIKEKNKGKKVYVVLGDMENRLLHNPNQRIINPTLQFILNLNINSLGYRQIDEDLAKSFGSKDYKTVASKIYTL